MKANWSEKLASLPRSAQITADLVAARWRLIGAPAESQGALLDAEAIRQMAQYQNHIENSIGTVKTPVGRGWVRPKIWGLTAAELALQ
jgi:hypothetical protein